MKREVEQYIEILNKGDFHEEVDPFVYWREKSRRFPNLSSIALQYLAMPATSASAERLFSCCGLSCKGKKTNVSSVLLESQTYFANSRKTLTFYFSVSNFLFPFLSLSPFYPKIDLSEQEQKL
jgi:hypothetical protein